MNAPGSASSKRRRARKWQASGIAGVLLILGGGVAQAVAFGDSAAAAQQLAPVECGNMEVGYHVVSMKGGQTPTDGVDAVTVSNVASACAGHALAVQVRDGSGVLGKGRLMPVAGEGKYTVALDKVAPVAAVQSVAVITAS